MQNIYFIGIGGIGVSAMARLLFNNGANVSGSDQSASAITNKLKEIGIGVKIGHKKSNVPEDVTMAIISPAISEENVEYKVLQKMGVPIITYPEALGALSQEKFTIAVAGSHGKSTTTAMIGSTLVAASYEPTVIVGTKVREFNDSNLYLGKSKYLVIEACEYKKSFLNLNPDILVLLNIDMDHFDYFKTEQEYLDVFASLISKLPLEGKLIANANDPKVMALAEKAHCQVITFGLDTKSDYSLQNKSNLYHHYSQIGELKLQLPGQHNRQNALAAFSTAHELNVPTEISMPNLYRYKGSWRRLDYRGNLGNTKIYDDYAHHPTEIRATISALKELDPNSRICCVFQPHQHNRTLNLFEEFGHAFQDCDHVLISDIYSVRDSEADESAINSEKLSQKINENGTSVEYSGSLKSTAATIKKLSSQFDVVAIMGAGDIYKITEDLIS